MASIQKRPDGRYRARYRDDAGKEHARHFDLKRDAQRWLDEVTTSVVVGQYVHPDAGRVTWAQWCETWMKRQTWTTGTHEAAHTAVDHVPWASSSLRSVKPSQVQAWVTAETKRGLAASTIKTRLSLIQMAFRAAVIDKLIATNPASGVKAPRQRRPEASMKLLTPAQVHDVIAAAGDFSMFVQVCVFAGLRLGEAAGLQLGDVDFMHRSITVSRQVQGATKKTMELVPPKYGSERTVYIPDGLALALSGHVAQLELQAADDVLLPDMFGRRYNRSSAGEQWRRIRASVGLPDDVTLHTLRHTFASSLIAQGCDVVTVQRALGHSQPSITLNVYSHLWPSAEDRTRAAMADFMASVADSADSVRTKTGKTQVRQSS